MKRKILVVLAIITTVIMAFPFVVQAYVTNGWVDATRQYPGGPQVKYTYINGANVSLYYIYGDGSYYAYPFGTPNGPGSPDTPLNTPAYLTNWSPGAIGSYQLTVYPRIGGSYGNWGTQYAVGGVTNEKVKVAAAIILQNGYPLSSAYTGYGIDWLRAQYATNVALQNLSALCCGGGENTAYYPTAGNEATAAFCYDLGQAARKYLANSTANPLTVSPSSQTMTVEGNYFVANVTFSLPTVTIGNRSQYYKNNYSINTAAFPAGAVFEGYTGFLDSSGTQTVKIKVPINGNGAKTFSSSATGIYINRTANVNLYNIGYSCEYTREITADEAVAIYTNDVSTPAAGFSLTTPSQPDLAVSGLTSDKSSYEAGETVTITTVAANLGYTPVSSTTMKLEISGIGTQSKTVSSLAANGGTKTVSFTFTAPTALNSQTVTLKATIDPNNTVAESNENNNTRTAALGVNALRPDITIVNTSVQNWYAGKEAVVSATVKNLTSQPVPSVEVRFKIGNTVLTKSIPIAGNGSNLAVFRFTVPQAGNYTVSLTADPSGGLGETNENNNMWSGQVTVINLPNSIVFDPDDTGMKQQYDVFGLKDLPEISNSDYHTWQEVRLEKSSYVTKNFWARLTTTFAISPDSRIAQAGKSDVMESGFGVQVGCITTLTSNYDHPDDLIGPQMVWVRYPESGYGQTSDWQNVRDSLVAESGDAGDWSITWEYAINPYSSTASRLHYTPLWFPDGEYTALAQVFYAWSPVGQLYSYSADSVTIEGDMYDRITTVGR